MRRYAALILTSVLLLLAWNEFSDAVGRILYMYDQGQIVFFEDDANGSNSTTLRPRASLAADYTLTLPIDGGSAGQFLFTDGAGNLSWGAGNTNLNSAYEAGRAITADLGPIAMSTTTANSLLTLSQSGANSIPAMTVSHTGSGNALEVTGPMTLSGSLTSQSTWSTSAAAGKTTVSLTDTGANIGMTIGGDTTLYRSGVNALMTDDNFYISGPHPFVDVRAYGTNDGAFTQAIAALPSTGGTVFVPEGAYSFSSAVVIDKNNVTIFAPSYAAVCTPSVSGIACFTSTGRSRVAIIGLQFSLSNANTLGVSLNAGTSGQTSSNVILRDLIVTASHASATGIELTSSGGDWSRARIERVTCTNSDLTPTGIGIRMNTGAGNGFDSTIRACATSGFQDGISIAGVWQRTLVAQCSARNARRYGGEFRNMGECRFVGCEFSNNDVGAHFDGSAGNSEMVVTGCRFIGNLVLGAMTQEWENGVFNACVFESNANGFWLGSGRKMSITGCAIVGNTNWGLNTDKDASFTAVTAGDIVLAQVNSLMDVLISGCVISNNGTNGIELRGVRDYASVTGCMITRNGTSSNTPATSTFADVFVGTDGTGGACHTVSIKGNSIGRSPESVSEPLDGGEQYGIQQQNSGVTFLIVNGNDFWNLTEVINASTGDVYFLNNVMLQCAASAITLSGGTDTVYRNNVIETGSALDGDAFDGLEQTTATGEIVFGQGITAGDTLNMTQTADTISTDSIGYTAANMILTGEGGIDDDLITINGGTAGDLIIIQAVAGDIITLRETGNFALGAATRVLNSVEDKIILLSLGGAWHEIVFSDNG